MLASQRYPLTGISRVVDRSELVVSWLLIWIAVVYVILVSLLDAGCFFELGFGLRFVAIGFLLISPIIAFVRIRAVKRVVVSSVIWMLVLPYVRWNEAKAFFVDARRLELGMSASEAREVMRDYLEFGKDYVPTAEERQDVWMPLPPDPRYAIVFLSALPAPEWPDQCEVRFDAQGHVSRIDVEKAD